MKTTKAREMLDINTRRSRIDNDKGVEEEGSTMNLKVKECTVNFFFLSFLRLQAIDDNTKSRHSNYYLHVHVRPRNQHSFGLRGNCETRRH